MEVNMPVIIVKVRLMNWRNSELLQRLMNGTILTVYTVNPTRG